MKTYCIVWQTEPEEDMSARHGCYFYELTEHDAGIIKDMAEGKPAETTTGIKGLVRAIEEYAAALGYCRPVRLMQIEEMCRMPADDME